MTDSKFRLEVALEQSKSRKKQINFSNCTPIMDHECRHFRSIREMCRFWGIEDATYRYRRSKGLDKKTALTLPPLKGKKEKL